MRIINVILIDSLMVFSIGCLLRDCSMTHCELNHKIMLYVNDDLTYKINLNPHNNKIDFRHLAHTVFFVVLDQQAED